MDQTREISHDRPEEQNISRSISFGVPLEIFYTTLEHPSRTQQDLKILTPPSPSTTEDTQDTQYIKKLVATPVFRLANLLGRREIKQYFWNRLPIPRFHKRKVFIHLVRHAEASLSYSHSPKIVPWASSNIKLGISQSPSSSTLGYS